MLTTQASHGRCENGGYQERIKLACGHIKNYLSLGNWEDAGEEGWAFSEEKSPGDKFLRFLSHRWKIEKEPMYLISPL